MKEQQQAVNLEVLDYTEQQRTALEISLIYSRLESICDYFEKEYKQKQLVIGEQGMVIKKLKEDLDDREATIAGLKDSLGDCLKNSEGNRQLINKLLNDIGHYQNELEWYRRTYEKRSFLGILREKLRSKNK